MCQNVPKCAKMCQSGAKKLCPSGKKCWSGAVSQKKGRFRKKYLMSGAKRAKVAESHSPTQHIFRSTTRLCVPLCASVCLCMPLLHYTPFHIIMRFYYFNPHSSGSITSNWNIEENLDAWLKIDYNAYVNHAFISYNSHTQHRSGWLLCPSPWDSLVFLSSPVREYADSIIRLQSLPTFIPIRYFSRLRHLPASHLFTRYLA